jgi:hypothetical protein
MLPAYLHPGDLTLSDWLYMLLTWLLIIGVPVAIIFIVFKKRDLVRRTFAPKPVRSVLDFIGRESPLVYPVVAKRKSPLQVYSAASLYREAIKRSTTFPSP